MDLVNVHSNLPSTIEDLSKFILVGREKLTSVRAEIRAIDKLNLAQEVREQKREECLMLSEALLDAEVKIGDLLKQLPKAKNQYDNAKDSGVHSISKTKSEIVNELGFTEKQKQRFEILAENKDIVEQVKAEARENDDMPTRSRVLDLAQQRKKSGEAQKKETVTLYKDCKPVEVHIFGITDFSNLSTEQFNDCLRHAKNYRELILKINELHTDLDSLRAWYCIVSSKEESLLDLDITQKAIQKLMAIQNYFKGVKK